LYGGLLPNLFFSKQDLEQFCENGHYLQQQSDKHLEGKQTYGGYSTSVVVDEKFYAFQKI
jgi:D-arabinose 1-dehydrogenase-like Zn-dependent alcohol dehydrogenase